MSEVNAQLYHDAIKTCAELESSLAEAKAKLKEQEELLLSAETMFRSISEQVLIGGLPKNTKWMADKIQSALRGKG